MSFYGGGSMTGPEVDRLIVLMRLEGCCCLMSPLSSTEQYWRGRLFLIRYVPGYLRLHNRAPLFLLSL